MRTVLAALMLLLSACSSTGTSPVVDAGPGTDAGPVDAGRPDPLRLPDGGCPACERDGICQPGDQLDACGSSGACSDCNHFITGQNDCAAVACESAACRIIGAKTPYTACRTGRCPDLSANEGGLCISCGHSGEECCPSREIATPAPAPCVDGGMSTCTSGAICP